VRGGREARADDLDLAVATPEQQVAAAHEGLDDGVAQLGDVVHRVAELVGVELEQRGFADGPDGDERGPAGQHVHLAGELPGVHPGDRPGILALPVGGLELALANDIEAEAGVAGGVQDVAGADGSRVAAGRQRGEVAVAEGRIGGVQVGGHDGLGVSGRDRSPRHRDRMIAGSEPPARGVSWRSVLAEGAIDLDRSPRYAGARCVRAGAANVTYLADPPGFLNDIASTVT
jgi:hypothetical protein